MRSLCRFAANRTEDTLRQIMDRATQSRTVIASLILVTFCILLGVWFRERAEVRYDRQILAAARRYMMDPALIKAVIWQESRFNARARGKAGEIGLMQIREDAAFEWADAEKMRGFAHHRILDPEANILCGTFYLAKVIKRYGQTDNPVAYALADYNAGRSHVLRWAKGAAQTNSAAFLAQMDFPRTREYAHNIIERRAKYVSDFQKQQIALR
jgi:soluble lytic murein transglycosylase